MDEGSGDDGADGAGGKAARLQANKSREVQLARTGGRKLFKGKGRKRFLKWFAATGNVVWSSAKAGYSDKTIWKHRMNDPGFAEAFDRAFEQSVARNKARMLERRMKAKPIAVDGGASEAELEDCDLEKAWPLIVEIERAKARGGGAPAGRPRKAGRPPRVASNAEVRSALEKRLRAFARRVRAGETAAAPPGPATCQETNEVPGTAEESLVPGTEEKSLVPGTVETACEEESLVPGTEEEFCVPAEESLVPGTGEKSWVPGAGETDGGACESEPVDRRGDDAPGGDSP